MSLPLRIHGVGSTGIFSSRAFLPAFATALLLRFGPQVPWLAHAGLLPHVRGVPTWFTSDRGRPSSSWPRSPKVHHAGIASGPPSSRSTSGGWR
jgi:hypothetical protein